MLASLQFLLVPLVLASYVSAHGYVANFNVGGKEYPGNGIGRNGRASALRQVTSQDPIKGANNPAVNCGTGATRAQLIADARPGDVMTFDWRTASGGRWPHNTGPIITYMASCGNTPCSEFDSTKARWFKIAQEGKRGNGQWVQQDIMNGGRARATIPSNLAPGNYLVRHEIIALHLAGSRGGAEFYAGCAQIRLGGNGNAFPAANELVSLPGAYNDGDPGIHVNAFSNAAYTFPGPPIARLAGTAPSNNNGGNNGGNNNNTPTTSSKAPAATSTAKNATPTTAAAGGKTTKICRLRKNSKRAAAPEPTPAPEATAEANENFPRHVSRIMRRFAFEGGFEAKHGSA